MSDTTREALMLILHEQGAFCGLCDYENAIYDDRSDGMEWRCADCELCLGRYASAILESEWLQSQLVTARTNAQREVIEEFSADLDAILQAADAVRKHFGIYRAEAEESK